MSILWGLLLIALPLLSEWMNGLVGHQAIPLYVLAAICLMMVILLFSRARKRLTINLTLADLFVLAYLMYGLLNIAFVKKFHVDLLVFYKWIAMGLGYILVRMLGVKAMVDEAKMHENGWIILFGLAISGLMQSIVTFLQSANLLESNHRMFEVTGTFGNPGQLGGFLAITFIAAVGLGLTYWTKWRKASKNPLNLKIKRPFSIVCGISAITILTALIISDSRAGWIAGLLALGYLSSLFGAKYLKPVFAKRPTRIAAIAVAALLIGLVVVSLYRYRPDSADGRLLTWRVSMGMIADKPVLGHGVGSFPEQYMLHQADFFQKYPDSPYAMVAGNITYPFNEYIYVGVEQGILGLLILSGLLAILLFSKNNNPMQRVHKAGLLAWCVFAFFSYPSSVFPLLFLFVVFAGLIQTKIVVSWALHAVWRWVFTLACVGIIGFSIIQIQFYRETDRHIRMLRSKSEDERNQADTLIRDNYEKLRMNRIFMNVYSQMVYRHLPPQERLPILEDAVGIIPSCELLCDLGDTYQALGQYDEAEQVFITASHMLPSRMIPNYLLFTLYREIGNLPAARFFADRIVSRPIKIVSTATIRMKAEATQWIEETTDAMKSDSNYSFQ